MLFIKDILIKHSKTLKRVGKANSVQFYIERPYNFCSVLAMQAICFKTVQNQYNKFQAQFFVCFLALVLARLSCHFMMLSLPLGLAVDLAISQAVVTPGEIFVSLSGGPIQNKLIIFLNCLIANDSSQILFFQRQPFYKFR